MKKLVNVPYPLNLSESNKSLYQNYTTYEHHPIQIKKLKNVFITFSGFCLNNKGLIKESHHNYPMQLNDYKNEAAKYYYDIEDNPQNLITFDDENIYLAIHHPWFNYFHWITESIFRLWMVRRHTDKLILVLPKYYEAADFIMGSLEPFKLNHIYYIPQGKSLLVNKLCLPPIKPICDSFNSLHVKQVRAFYTNYVQNEKKIKVGTAEKLYISRELASRRKIINEHNVLDVLKKYGFTIFYPEKVSFLEQVAVFTQVKFLIGTHGSGLTNMLFMPKKSSLLELHKDKTNELDHPSPLFWYLAEALQIKYYHQLCETHGREDYFEGDYIVDTDVLEQNIQLLLQDC